MPRGVVKKFDEERGWGFITPDAGGKDIFVHFTGINEEGFRTLNKRDKVEYEVEEGKEGRPQATNVERIGG